PFAGGSIYEKMRQHCEQEPDPVSQSRPEVPRELAAVVQRMMAKRPGDRPPSAREVAFALAPFCAPAAGPVLVHAAPAPPAAAPARRELARRRRGSPAVAAARPSPAPPRPRPPILPPSPPTPAEQSAPASTVGSQPADGPPPRPEMTCAPSGRRKRRPRIAC